MSVRRIDALSIVDEERDYQDSLPQHSESLDASHSVGDWAIFMEQLIKEAKSKVYELDQKGAMEFIRKATAVGVAAIEYNDTPRRK